MKEIIPIGTPTQTKTIINKYHFHINKRFGQNFLINPHILKKIVSLAQIKNKDIVIEIGPGLGALTEQIAKKAKKVIAYEIDKKLIYILHNTLNKYTNIRIVHEDFLKTNLAFFKQEPHIKLVANLPYYITSPVLFKIFSNKIDFDNITLTMQKEVAQRIQASPGSKKFGYLSLAVQYYFKLTPLTYISKNNFFPKPKVDSAVINMKIKPNFHHFIYEKQLFKIIKIAFSHRRKSLVNNLFFLIEKNSLNKKKLESIFQKLSLEKNIRGEKLNLKKYKELVNQLIVHKLIN